MIAALIRWSVANRVLVLIATAFVVAASEGQKVEILVVVEGVFDLSTRSCGRESARGGVRGAAPRGVKS